MHPSGIRLGTAVLTTIGMKEDDMSIVAAYISKAIDNYDDDSVLNSISKDIAVWVNRLNSGK